MTMSASDSHKSLIPMEYSDYPSIINDAYLDILKQRRKLRWQDIPYQTKRLIFTEVMKARADIADKYKDYVGPDGKGATNKTTGSTVAWLQRTLKKALSIPQDLKPDDYNTTMLALISLGATEQGDILTIGMAEHVNRRPIANEIAKHTVELNRYAANSIQRSIKAQEYRNKADRNE